MEKLLLENSTKKYYIIHHEYMFNHLSQGIIALHALGADNERLKRYIDDKSPALTPSELCSDTDNEGAELKSDISKLLGKSRSFYGILDYYEERLKTDCNNCLTTLLNQYLPNLSKGFIGGALHGIIQIGYGLSVDVARIVCEGLAYSHFSNIPLAVNASKLPYSHLSNLGKGNLDILDVLNDLHNDRELSAFLKTELVSDIWLKKYKGRFSRSAGILFTCRGDTLMSYAHSIRFPNWYRFEKLNRDQLQQLSKWVFQSTVTVYVLSERRNDFFLLHGVTAAWSLVQIIPRLNSVTDALECIQTFLCCLMAVYIIQGTPKLCSESVPNGLGSTQNDLTPWHDIVNRLLNQDTDTHIYKLVHVCYDMATSADDADEKKLYLQAANYALHNPLAYG